MPELPEVEVTRRLLAPRIVGRRIASASCSAPSYFFLTPPRRLQRDLPGRTIESLERVGKYLLMGLGGGHRLLMHLGMTGQLFVEGSTSPRLINQKQTKTQTHPGDPHLHLVLTFEDGPPGLWFRDVRKFGKVRWLGPDQSDERLDKLGPDALLADGELLFSALRSRRVPVKTVLLDQAVLAGVGNIYADEALFLAGVRPGRSAQRVTRNEALALAEGIRKVLERSIETGGSSISDFINPDGNDGHFQNERRVYARTGEPCASCGSSIARKVIGQRSSHFCPRCQR